MSEDWNDDLDVVLGGGDWRDSSVVAKQEPNEAYDDPDPDSEYFGPPGQSHGSSSLTESMVDGIGMWKSWTHNYEQPRFACLDLLDNCFDATLQTSSTFSGRVEMHYFPTNGMVILNNSCQPIKSLSDTLTAYRSQKNEEAIKLEDNGKDFDKKDAIGEYGVGLKQACATLADTSLVLTKTHHLYFQLGVIAKDLQTRNTVSLPHYSFSVQPDNPLPLDQQITTQLTLILRENPRIYHLVTNTIGSGNRKWGIDNLVQQFLLMSSGHWNEHPHVFQLIITNFNHSDPALVRRNSEGINLQPALQFLEEIRDLLPKHYINVPLHNFLFTIQDKPVKFSYWQHRLVEMTKFEVYIPKDQPVQSLPAETFAQTGYPLSIYCGFDAIRINDKHQPKTCQLCIYSRQSGRLIEVTADARDILGLVSSGVDFCQGLTVIIDDVRGELPLKPTKDGLTWSKDATGETHKVNLFVWAGAVAFMYWRYHAYQFETKCQATNYKTKLAEAVASFTKPVQQRLQQLEETTTVDIHDNSLERVEDAKFCMFSDVLWKISQNQVSLKVDLKPKKHSRHMILWKNKTPATVWKFDDSHYPAPSDAMGVATPMSVGSMKRGRPTASIGSNKKRRGSVIRTSGYLGSPPLVGSAPPAVMQHRNHGGFDSSSGEEEEQVVAELFSPTGVGSPLVPVRKLAFASPEAVRHVAAAAKASGRDRKGILARKKAPRVEARQSSLLSPLREDESARCQKLEEALKNSQEEVQTLLADLNQARRQLMHPQTLGGGTNAMQELAAAKQECAMLQLQNRQLQYDQGAMQAAREKLQQVVQENSVLLQQKHELEQNLQTSQQAQLSLQKTLQENAQLKQEKVILERNVQEIKERGIYEISRLKLKLQEMEFMLSEKQKTIENMQMDLNQSNNTLAQLSGGANGFHWGGGSDSI